MKTKSKMTSFWTKCMWDFRN